MNQSRLLAVALFASLLTAASLGAADVGDGARPLLSEDFESGRLDPAVWSQEVTGANVITVQSDKVAHGKFALKVSCPAPSNKTWAFIAASHLPAALKQHQYGRAYVLVTPRPPARHIILLMSGTPGFPKNKFEEVATANGRWQITYVDLARSPTEEDYHSAGAVPLDRWFCLEWEFNDHPDHAAVWVDGKPIFASDFVSKSTHATSDLVGAFTDIAFGFRLWGAAPEAFDVYYDDIVIDTKPVGPIGGK
jgi:hypothetical protein